MSSQKALQKMRKVAYTVIAGDGYNLYPHGKHKGWDFVCLTTSRVLSRDWDVIEFSSSLSNKKASRYPKVLYQDFLSGYDLSVYHDSRFQIKSSLDDFVREYLPDDKDMALMNHPKRSCLYDEGSFCSKKKIDKASIIRPQMDRYIAEGYPKNNGLNAGGIIIRRHGVGNVEDCMRTWFGEIAAGSWRDQLSLNYALWKNPVNLSTMPFKKLYKLWKP